MDGEIEGALTFLVQGIAVVAQIFQEDISDFIFASKIVAHELFEAIEG